MDKGSRRRSAAVDLAICALLLYTGWDVTTQTGADVGAGAGTDVDTILVPLLVLPVLLRRSRPFGAAVAFAAACVVTGLPTLDQFRIPVVLPVALLVVYPVARDTDRWRAVAGLVLVQAGTFFVALTDSVVKDNGGLLSTVAFVVPLYTGLWAAGRLVRSGDRVAAQLAARSAALERQREESAQLAVEIERTQLASDLDAAARARVREMLELTEEGERSLAGRPELAREVFARIEALGRDSLNEMRGLLGVLRSDERGPRSPRPTLAELDDLLADTRRGGRLVDLSVEGDRRPLPDAVELAAYRVVQHALVAVHGTDGEAARIELHYLPSALELRIDGAPADGTSARAALAAARERVAAQGGTFSTARPAPGRQLLRALLPAVAASA